MYVCMYVCVMYVCMYVCMTVDILSDVIGRYKKGGKIIPTPRHILHLYKVAPDGTLEGVGAAAVGR